MHRWSMIVAVAATIGGVGCEGASAPATAPGAISAIQDPAVRYVGREACRICHIEIYRSHVETGMGRSFYPVSPERMIEDFEHDNVIEVAATGLRYRMERRGDRFYQRQFLIDSRGAEIAIDEHELRYVVGSNNHGRTYVVEISGKLFQAPICWYPMEERWEFCPGYQHKNDHFSREISASCVFCHNARMEQVAGERNRYQEPFPHGIDCERCHGPGERHVERWAHGGEIPQDEPDPTIVNPRRLPLEARREVCFQCHLGEAGATERVIRQGRRPEMFRPGQRASEIWAPFRYQEKLHDFGLSAQADRMMLSRCFTESEGKLECLTCHDPHRSVYDPELAGERFRQACLGCHDVDTCAGSDAHRATTQPADDCVDCHMRRGEPDDQRFSEFTDHWIRRQLDGGERGPRRDFTMEPIDPETLATLPLGEQRFYHARAVSLKALDAPASARVGLRATAEQEFRAAIAAGFDTADLRFFLGKLLLAQQRTAEAIAELERAAALEPLDPDKAFALGQAFAASGRSTEALAVFQSMLDRNPDLPMALAEAGRVRATLGDAARALEFYSRAAQLEPWNAVSQLNWGMTLAASGDLEAAAARALAAVALDPESPAAWDFHVRVHEALGRTAVAAEGRRIRDRLTRTPRSSTPDRAMGG